MGTYIVLASNGYIGDWEEAMAEKKRMANLELLRCVAMMMVVVLHYLGKGGLLPDLTGECMDCTGVAAWLLEAFCIVAVNVYMFISGYFLCTSHFKLSRLLQLWFQLWMYSVVFGVLGALTGVVAETPVDTHYFLTLLFPVSMGHYWFMTAYIFLYLLLPFVDLAARKMTKQQMQIAVGALFTVFCVIKSVLPFRLEMDAKGYDCLWYLCVFLAAAYVRRFGVPFLEKRGRGILLYIGCCLLAFGGTLGLRAVYLRTGSLGRMVGMCMEYNHILPFLAAVGLFAAFSRLHVNEKISHVINKIATHTLGVYLLHENLGLRYTWQKWLGASKTWGLRVSCPEAVTTLILRTLTAVVCVFVCGILVDMARAGLMKGIHCVLSRFGCYQRLTEKIAAADRVFTERKDGEEKAKG